jgi:hypothetical protein
MIVFSINFRIYCYIIAQAERGYSVYGILYLNIRDKRLYLDE